MTDIEIAKNIKVADIVSIANSLGLKDEDYELYGNKLLALSMACKSPVK